MSSSTRTGLSRSLILVVVVVAVVTTLFLRNHDGASETQVAAQVKPERNQPTLLDLGADKCIPCKAMVPVLAELEAGLAGELTVKFIDVWQNPEEAKDYHINLIPTQIFLDAEGEELFRHEGFFARDDILAKWRELGYEFALPADQG